MKPTEQTFMQLERVIRKIVQKFPHDDDSATMTDIHLRVFQDSGELLAFDDDEQEITRCVVEQWIENKDDKFYEHVTDVLRKTLQKLRHEIDDMGILKPYSFVLENDDKEHVAELYVADDDTVILGGELMEDLDQDLDNFFSTLFLE